MKMRMIISIAIIIFVLTSAYGQQNDAEARGCVTDEGKELSFLVGDWKVKNQTRVAGGDEKWDEHNGSSKIKFIFDQCLLAEKLTIKREGRPLTVFVLYSYNNISKNYQWAFAHSEHGMLSLYEGLLEKDKFDFRYSFEIGDRIRLFKRELTRSSNGFELVASRSNNNGETWRVDSRLTYYR